jgi:hypothetical protein
MGVAMSMGEIVTPLDAVLSRATAPGTAACEQARAL